jgi:hypothetical protein
MRRRDDTGEIHEEQSTFNSPFHSRYKDHVALNNNRSYTFSACNMIGQCQVVSVCSLRNTKTYWLLLTLRKDANPAAVFVHPPMVGLSSNMKWLGLGLITGFAGCLLTLN